MDGFAEHLEELEKLGAKVVAASVDDAEKAGEIAAGKGFAFGYGVNRADADAIGAWWEERRAFIQPSEFVLNADNKVVASSYSAGPIARMDAADAIRLVSFLEKQKKG